MMPALTTKEAELKVAQINLAAEKASAEGEKNSLLEQKQQHKKQLKQQQQLKQLTVHNKLLNFRQFKHLVIQNPSAQIQAVSGGTPAAAAPAPAAAVSNVSYSSDASTYPVGQCTWGVKTLAPWAGNYWGNGGQWAASAAAAGFRGFSTTSWSDRMLD